MKLAEQIRELAAAARQASKHLARLTTAEKNHALMTLADRLLDHEAEILAANQQDLTKATENGLSTAMCDRLRLDGERLKKMADALREVADLADPVGEITRSWTRPNGIQVAYQRIPLGVVCMIFESRPNVTSDAAGLCLKSGNGVILRGGKEAFFSNMAIAAALHAGLRDCGIPEAAISIVPTTDRAAMTELFTLTEYIDLVIPRGGEGLIRFVDENSRIPVIKHYKGVCHLFVDESADIEKALDILFDGKLSRPGVCNALETLLVHEKIAEEFLPKAAAMLQKNGAEIRGCAQTQKLIPGIKPADEKDYAAEFLDLIISVRVVTNMDAALAHIETYTSDDTEVIVTNDLANSQRFVREVNSSVVMVNASSRFSDGGELGLGAEIGISTTKLHAYGPMGLEALTTRKFVVMGAGQTRHP
ncbi:glutamate-5-semialdehyde dehydrogenase, partial [bacterium]|nr:glutamate-5-semialdehyde dehydrogenase [bacterium]